MSTRVVPHLKAEFIRYELENGDARRKKVALQDIARIYRAGQKFNPENQNGLELVINGLLSGPQDEKVTRWCLNCIAQMGTRDKSLQSVELAIRRHEGKPEIVAAAVAAAARLYAGRLDFCDALGAIQPQIKTLAALQVTPPSRLDLDGFRIEVDTANDEILKLALITVGLNKAYENMFHPKHSNASLVKALGQHDNKIVRQYSVWCVIENENIQIEDLGIPFETIDREPPNVQSKMLELGARQIADLLERHSIIEMGTFNQDVEAREGLAKGILHSFYDGLEGITVDWYEHEGNPRVKALLAQHFGRFGDDCQSYLDKAFEIMEGDDVELKKRIRLGVSENPMSTVWRKFQSPIDGPDLFPGDRAPIIDRVIESNKRQVKNILLMCASPRNGMELRLGQESRDIKEALRLVDEPKIDMNINHAWAIRIDQIQKEILNHTPNILHFSGHGDIGELYFEDKDGNAAPVRAAAIVDLIELCGSVECLFLNACYSDSISRWVLPYVQTVIGCSDEVRDEAAIYFSKTFYQSISRGFSYEKAYKLAINDLRIMGKETDARVYTIRAESLGSSRPKL